MSELFREIEEDIKSERAMQLWQQFGKVLLGVSVVIVLATVAYEVWQDHREKVAMEQTGIFSKGVERLQAQDYKGAQAEFDKLVKDTRSPYYGLAMLRKAQIENTAGDSAAAVKTYKDLAANGTGKDNEAFGALAAVLVSGETDKLLDPSPISPLYYLQSERKAWQLVGQNKNEEAGQIFLSLVSDDQAPGSLRERSAEALQEVAPDKLAALAKAKHAQ